MELRSPAFTDGDLLPRLYTAEGEDLSPPLNWCGVPAGCASLLLLLDDPDAPGGTWVHWVLFDLPPSLTGLPAGLPKTPVVSEAGGARHGSCWGVSRFERIGYQGPAPPPGAAHHYRFRLIALDTRLERPPGTTPTALLAALRGHQLAEARLTALYAARRLSGSGRPLSLLA